MNSYQTLSAYYDRFTDDVGYGQWADFFEQLFAREDIRPQLVLDLACGTGSLTRLLAQRGYDMIHLQNCSTLRQKNYYVKYNKRVKRM